MSGNGKGATARLLVLQFHASRRAKLALLNPKSDPKSTRSQPKVDQSQHKLIPKGCKVNPKSVQRALEPMSAQSKSKVNPTSAKCLPKVGPNSFQSWSEWTSSRPKVGPELAKAGQSWTELGQSNSAPAHLRIDRCLGSRMVARS